MRNLSPLWLASAAVVLLPACDRQSPTPPPDSSHFPVEQLGHFYQANGHIAMDQFADAVGLLAQVREQTDDPAVLANQAVTLLGTRKPDEAEPLARLAAASAPNRADMALIHAAALEALNRRDEAVDVLRAALQHEPHNAAARWRLIGLLEAGDAGDETVAGHYEALLAAAPRNLAAVLAAAVAAARQGDVAAAGERFDRALALVGEPPEVLHERIAQLPAAVEAGDRTAVLVTVTMAQNVMRAGDRFRADILALGARGAPAPPPVAHPLRPISAAPQTAAQATIRLSTDSQVLGLDGLAAPGVKDAIVGTLGDDRAPTVYVLIDGAPGRLWSRRDNRFEDLTDASGLLEAGPADAAIFFDVNNDRRMDLLLFTDAATRVFVQQADGRFADETAARGLADAGGARGGLPFDFEGDGDLDLLRWDTAALFVHINDGEGRFSLHASAEPLPLTAVDIRAARATDLDDDGDIDLALVCGDGPCAVRVFSNERRGRFREITELAGELEFTTVPVLADLDNDGWFELRDPADGRWIEIGEDFAARERGRDEQSEPGAVHAIACDLDCDGALDLVRVWPDGHTSLNDVRVQPGATLLDVDLDGDGAIDLMSTRGEIFLNRTDGRGHWLSLAVAGLNQGDSKFNAFGLGSVIELRAGPLYQKRTVDRPVLHFGLGPYATADVLRIIWPNGSYQNVAFRTFDRMALAADRLIVQEQTLKGSCPYLYAWDGRRYRFVTDVLWRSAIGMPMTAASLAGAYPADEYFRIPGDTVRPRDGEYVLQLTEELWETAYFDYCRLLVVDHPADTDVFVNEACLPGPYPPFEIHVVGRRRPPLSAIDHAGRDVTALLTKADRRYVADFEPTRYQGLVGEHALTLDLGPFDAAERVTLFLQGWVMPTDASLNIAIDQHPELAVRPPTLSVVGADGRWQPLDLIVGFPSGKSKTLVIDLTSRFSTDDHRVRIDTNMAIYWDAAFVGVAPPPAEPVVTELPIASADLHHRGFSRHYRVAPDGPDVPDYDSPDRDRQWRDLIGRYTRYGDVTPLLRAPDSMYAIINAGDEVTLRFDAAAAPPLPDGWRRDFVIHTDGWLKDGDLSTATGKTVEPLPFRGMSAYPPPPGERYPDGAEYEAYQAEYNTRVVTQGAFRERVRPREELRD